MRIRRRSSGVGSGWSGVGGSGSDATGSAAQERARGGRSGDGRGHLMATSETNDPLVPCQPAIDKFLGLLSNACRSVRQLDGSPIMNKRFVVRLSVEERERL